MKFQVLFGPQTNRGDRRPRYTETGDGEGLHQLPKQNGEDTKQSMLMFDTMRSLVSDVRFCAVFSYGHQAVG